MIKKILVVLIIIFGFFTVVFAENSDPFANVKGIALTDEEMAMVEGGFVYSITREYYISSKTYYEGSYRVVEVEKRTYTWTYNSNAPYSKPLSINGSVIYSVTYY